MAYLVNPAIAQEIIAAAKALSVTSTKIDGISARRALNDWLVDCGAGQHIPTDDGAVTLVIEIAQGMRYRER
jgi:hypothetical protein